MEPCRGDRFAGAGCRAAVRIVNASRQMSWEEIQGHVPAIKAHFEKLARRFPTDLTVNSLLGEVLEGRKELWLILDGDRVLATCCTAIETINATGVRIARLMDLAGNDIGAWAGALNKALEAWGTENGVDYYAVEGRSGWGRVIEPMGYRKHATLWRKRA